MTWILLLVQDAKDPGSAIRDPQDTNDTRSRIFSHDWSPVMEGGL